MQYVIECEGVLSGPFVTEREAAEYALKRCSGRSWRLRSLHVVTV